MTTVVLRNATLVESVSGGPRKAAITLVDGRIAAADSGRCPGLTLDRPVGAADRDEMAYTLDLDGHLIFPGLINAHDHLHRNALPARALPKPDGGYWANSYEWSEAWQGHMADPDVVAIQSIPAAQRHWHGGLKNLLCGATTVVHHDQWHPVFEDQAFPVRVPRIAWSHSLGLGSQRLYRGAAHFGPPVEESFAATPPDQPWMIHLAEGTDATAAAELTILDELGCLAGNTILVHGVGLTDGDVTRIIKRRAGVVWCPGSNMGMLGRTLCPRRLMDAGLLALGTDSRISGTMDLLTEMQFAASATGCGAEELFRLVTDAPSRLLRMPDAGGLAPGQQADLLIVRDSRPTPAPCGKGREYIPTPTPSLKGREYVDSRAGTPAPHPEMMSWAKTSARERPPGQPWPERHGYADQTPFGATESIAGPCEALIGLRRADIRAVVRGGRPAIADPDFADWFDACGIAVAQVCLDGKPKLMDAALLVGHFP